MSAAAHDHASDHNADSAHGHHAPEGSEVSSPILWTACILAIIGFLVWLFFHYLASGRVVGRHHYRRISHRLRMPAAKVLFGFCRATTCCPAISTVAAN